MSTKPQADVASGADISDCVEDDVRVYAHYFSLLSRNEVDFDKKTDKPILMELAIENFKDITEFCWLLQTENLNDDTMGNNIARIKQKVADKKIDANKVQASPQPLDSVDITSAVSEPTRSRGRPKTPSTTTTVGTKRTRKPSRKITDSHQFQGNC